MQCSRCGRAVDAESVFCPQCGQRLADQDGLPSGAEALRATSYTGKSEVPEEELWSGTFSPKALFGPLLVIILLSVLGLAAVIALEATSAGWLAVAVGLALLWLGLGLVLAYRRLTVRYRLTTFRFFHERGLLSRVTDRIEVIDIDDVTVRQGLVERMFGVGTLVIQSSDRTDPELVLPGIDEVRHVADTVDDVRRAERQRRGLHIEAI